jgi:hypothetical protein
VSPVRGFVVCKLTSSALWLSTASKVKGLPDANELTIRRRRLTRTGELLGHTCPVLLSLTQMTAVECQACSADVNASVRGNFIRRDAEGGVPHAFTHFCSHVFCAE